MTPPSAAAAAAQPARRVAPPRPRRAPVGPRRISGPARPRTRTAPAEGARDGLVVGLLGAAETLSSNRLLDRLIGGRLWIGIVAFALIGIVTLQLGLLKLNSGIGRALERTASLQRENAALSIENSELASGTRVESQAERLGLRLSSVEDLHFLSSHESTDASRAAEVLRKPLVPTGEPPGGETATSESSEASEASSGGETSTSGEAPSSESSTASEPTAPATESPTTPTGTEAGAATAPTSETTPASTEAGGGTAGPTG
jgi:cell division protein FtsL